VLNPVFNKTSVSSGASGAKRARLTRRGYGVQGVSETAAPIGLPLPGADSSGDELFRLGLLYSTGQGGAPLDYISAHMLFNLAAMRGSEEAKIYRRELSREMDQEEVAEAQRQARKWLGQE
jgi:hypothetical protein